MRRLIGIVMALAIVTIALCVALPPRYQPPTPPRPADLENATPLLMNLIDVAIGNIEQTPDDAGAWRGLGMVYHANGLLTEAAICYDTTLEIDPDQAVVWYYSAMLAWESGDWINVERGYLRAIELAPTSLPTHRKLGEWYLDNGRLRESRECLRKALQLDEEDLATIVLAARVHLQQSEWEAAVDVLEQLRVRAGRATAYVDQLLARAYRGLGRAEDADSTLAKHTNVEAPAWNDSWQRELRALRADSSAIMQQAKSMAVAGQTSRALALLEGLHDRAPNDANLTNNIAIVHELRGERDVAIGILRANLARHPDYYPSRFRLALALIAEAGSSSDSSQSATRAEAHRELDRALEVNPSYAPALDAKGRLLNRDGDLEQAANYLLAAARSSSDYARDAYDAARLLAQLARWADVHTALEPLLRHMPRFVDAHRLQAIAYEATQDYDRALAALSTALELQPEDESIAAAIERVEASRSRQISGQ